jgi:peptidoglycan/LPS O-acetylase OafA/YrhL
MTERIDAYDLARTFAILVVFFGHAIVGHDIPDLLKGMVVILSPGLTMSLLGFVSAALLSVRTEDTEAFVVKRLTRIYVPLFVCLSVILLIQSLDGMLTLTLDTVVHYMGLTGVGVLLSHVNTASVGAGLWFVTTILAMYLLLPLLRRLFRHPRGLVHLLIAIAVGLLGNQWLYAGGSWNVVIAFCIGTYLGVNGRLDRLDHKPAGLYIMLACCLLTLCALASDQVIPMWTRGFFLPFYPVVFMPLFFSLAKVLPRPLTEASAFFSVLSYEFYLLHFYFINEHLNALLGRKLPLGLQMVIGFALTLVLACILFIINSWIRRSIEAYLLQTPPTHRPPAGRLLRMRRFFVLPFQKTLGSANAP